MKTYYRKIIFLLIELCLLIPPNGAFAAASFPAAKKIAIQLFSEHRETLYCACKYTKTNIIDLASCNMQLAEPIKRAHRVEWEHMMPAENFGKHLQCWNEKICNHHNKKTKGRKCCEELDVKFRQMEGELYNLWPAVGLVNQARSNYQYTLLDSVENFYGCDFKVSAQAHKIEPANRAKGIVARANLFMSKKYDIKLSPSQRKLFDAWNKQFPPSLFEKKWASQVALIEGYPNPYILAVPPREMVYETD